MTVRLALATLTLVAAASTAEAQTRPSTTLAYRLPGQALDTSGAFDPAPEARADSAQTEPWIARDKAIHAGGSFLFVLAAQYVLTDKAGASNGVALPISAGVALGIGLAREVHDSRRRDEPHFSVRDLVADAVGVAVAAVVTQL